MPHREALRLLLQTKHRFALVSDLDWTMVDHDDGTHAALLALNALWTVRLAADSLLVFSTGRSPELYAALAAEAPLLSPDVLICSVGTEILVGPGRAPAAEWEAHLDGGGWDRDAAAAVAARFPELVAQAASEQRPHKASFKLYAAGAAQAAGVVANLRGQLAAAGLDAAVVFSGGDDVDVLPARASKGKALEFLLAQADAAVAAARGGGGGGGGAAAEGGAAATGGGDAEQGAAFPDGVLVCGDSGNDAELFAVRRARGCVVANAHADLREWLAEHVAAERLFHAPGRGPAGIRQALLHFDGCVPAARGGEAARRAEVVSLHRWFEGWFSAAVPYASPGGGAGGGEGAASDEGGAGEPAEGLERLERSMAPGFELVGPSGAVTRRAELLAWFADKGYGSRVDAGATAAAAAADVARALRGGAGAHGSGGGLSAALGGADSPWRKGGGGADAGGEPSPDPTPRAGAAAAAAALRARLLLEAAAAGGGGAPPPPPRGAFRVWVDAYSERALGPGLWAARYHEMQQRFGAGGGERTARVATAVLREAAGGGYQWELVHETWLAA